MNRSVEYRLSRYVHNPLRVFAPHGYSVDQYSESDFVKAYRSLLERVKKPAVCIIEHTGFSGLIAVNEQLGIPTISCIQNLEALDAQNHICSSRLGFQAQMLYLANEIKVLGRCTTRLFISKVEAGFISGLGLPSHYYPYLPVGEIQFRLKKIAEARQQGALKPGLFLIVGSAAHSSTGEAITWFVRQAQRNGLPKGIRIVVGGSHTDQLLPKGEKVEAVELRGTLDQEELERLLIEATAVLIPQFRGFGGVTRLPEMACAAVPVLVSEHPTFAIDAPPNVEIVDNNWQAWWRELEKLSHSPSFIKVTHRDYLAWEQSQRKTLTEVLGDSGLHI
ncbi:MAG: hypothetical protein H3C34_01745 [Caldilineaceae bacterium]|nr:hypothetical protein [Caldilineaceae bacterium]